MNLGGQDARGKPAVSVVIPFFEEEENAIPVLDELVRSLHDLSLAWEIVAVDDGSADHTLERLKEAARRHAGLRVLRMRRNAGQTAALQAGFDAAEGAVVISMDGDGQNDPAGIPLLLEKMEAGYDLVCGWRLRRQDRMLSRKLPSRLANWLIGAVTGLPIHDNGCSLKAYRSILLARMHLYGEQHRFIPALAALKGARIAEVPVPHRARRAGRSKYGISRTYKVLLDLLTIRLLKPLATFPALPFLALGGVCLALGAGLVLLIFAVGLREESAVVWPGIALLFIYLGGYQFMLAFLTVLLRQGVGGASLLNSRRQNARGMAWKGAGELR